MARTHKASLTTGKVNKTLLKLMIPMVFGLLGIMSFNLVDTFFVGKLGTRELAALSFTFPVVLILGSIALGLGMAASSVVSRALGEGNHEKVERLTTDCLILGVLIVAFFAVCGLLSIGKVFRMLGASGDLITLIKEYMNVWYSGVVFLVIPMVGNNAIRATGDTKTPSIIMLIAVVVNIILDPLLIFGIGPFPELKLAGAALATLIARAITLIVALWILIVRDKMITLKRVPFEKLIASWKKILYLALPTAGTRIIVPIVLGIITRIISGYGPEAVAAFGVSSRIEFFALTCVMALASVIAPFVGQNHGAGFKNRVVSAVKYGRKFSIIWGAIIFILMWFLAPPIAAIFNKDGRIISFISLYLRIASAGYGMYGILIISSSVLIVLNKPIHSAAIILTDMFIIYIPLAMIGSHFIGLKGIFMGTCFSYIFGGVISILMLNKVLKLSLKNI